MATSSMQSSIRITENREDYREHIPQSKLIFPLPSESTLCFHMYALTSSAKPQRKIISESKVISFKSCLIILYHRGFGAVLCTCNHLSRHIYTHICMYVYPDKTICTYIHIQFSLVLEDKQTYNNSSMSLHLTKLICNKQEEIVKGIVTVTVKSETPSIFK